ncbi:SDR family oxidoreductase [Pedobacter sp. SYSU D00535]|uniref:SDR family NAD(P)-dependent oxidoreductase n=1 Tax=Pedobacter sp. SYSU D00535 TaxID=2810308 RepID=UPI001A974055|nr:SDR family NAD(P)-dependent oxidoreductase [Pedobacter sp. SYSU D00535]
MNLHTVKKTITQRNFRVAISTSAILIFILIFATACSTSRLGPSGQKKMQGKTFVIVGASSGFGRGVAEELGRYKANVVLAARRTDLLEEIAKNIRSTGGTALVVTTDISKPEDVQALMDQLLKQYGKIDVWVNMAGVGAIGRFWDIPLEDHSRLIDINLKGFIYGSMAAVKQFRAQGYGTLINMGSIESENPLAYHASYAASKAGVRHLGQAINQELRLNGHKKIKVVTVEPWAVDTPFWPHAANYSGGTPRMAAMDPAHKVVNAVMRVSIRPRKELPVGWKARAAWISHHIFPHLTERISANIMHRYQIKTAPPAPPTSGSLHEPMKAGTEVEHGVRERIKRENKERRKARKD